MQAETKQTYSNLYSQKTCKLVTEGRITRLPHIVRTRFVYLHGSFYVLAGSERSDWVLNALHSAKSKFRLEEYVWSVEASRATPAESVEVHGAFERKYGGRVIKDWYSASSACIKLTPDGPPIKRAIRGEAEAATTFDEWLSKGTSYYQGIAGAFDSAAEEYDFTISNNYINVWIRQRSIDELLRLVHSEDTLIEVGCGTGAEALIISRNVRKIIATDISRKMIELIRTKTQARNLVGKIVPVLIKASEISKATDYIDGGRASVIYSFNGALNCEPNLPKFVDELASVLVDDGFFVCTIRNSLCFTEAVSHAAVLQFEKMFPRKKQPVMVSVGGTDIPSFYYSPSTFAKYFERKFKLRKLIGLPAILPPAYLSDYYVKFKRMSPILERTELVLSEHFPFNRLGDQTLFVFQKK